MKSHTDPMNQYDRELYQKWRRHAIRSTLKSAGARPLYEEEIKALGLDARHERAFREAVERVSSEKGSMRPVTADRLSKNIMESQLAANPQWETVQERRQRLADFGDPQAIAELKLQREHVNSLSAQIWEQNKGLIGFRKQGEE